MYNQLNIKELDVFLEKIKGFDFSKSIEIIDTQFEFFLDSIDKKRICANTCNVYDVKKQSDEMVKLFQDNTDFQYKILYFIDSGVNYSDLLKDMFSGFLAFVQNHNIGANYVHDAYMINSVLIDFYKIMELEGKKKFQKKTNQL
jgi:hypothetical protein